MAYVTKKPGALGDVSSVLGTAKDIVEDPCLFEVLRRGKHISDLVTARSGPSSGPPTKGVGLCSVIAPLRVAEQIAERPWIVPVGAVAIVGLLFGIGYSIGRDSR
jgi:hypothetical protein